VYALAIDKKPIGPHTPIYDLETTFPWDYKPNNYNSKFSGKMTIMSALNASRNITAIKAYFLAGQQDAIIPFMKTLWVNSLNPDFYYGAPLALWAGELKPIELAQAYTVFANNGNKVDINPILKILDSKWLVIEEKKKVFGKRVMDESVAYITNYMLSNSASRDAGWNVNLTLKWRLAAAKTGTSNKQFIWKNGKKEIAPGDLWTAWYTPDFTTIVWVGNTNGKAIAKNGDGLNWAAPIWKNFMEFAHTGKKASEWKRPSDLKSAQISKISWYLAPAWFDPSFTISSFFKNRPTQYDNSFREIEVDMMCNGKVTPNTPVW
jgi:penicillin-binding protein 1A